MLQTININTPELNQRLDIYLVGVLHQYNRSKITKMIKSGKISVNDQIVKPGYMLKKDDDIKIDHADMSYGVPASVEILYEDDNVIVLNKPCGMLTHSKGENSDEPSVALAIQNKIYGLRGNRAGIVHRLDRGTSGVLVTAKNEPTLKILQKQFANRKVIKKYIAVINGKLKETSAIIDVPILRDPKNPKNFKADAHGKQAQTEYHTIVSKNDKSLIEVLPKTGRTHQIRVHLAHLGHPIIGDIFYNGMPYERLMLHAKSIELTIPDKGRKIFYSKTPPEFNDIMMK